MQVAALAAAALGDQHARAGDTGGVELPHLDVLHREAGAQRHADAVAGVDVGVGGRGVDTSRAAGGEHRRLRLHVDGFAGFHADRDDADHGAVLVLDQVDREPLVEEHGLALQVALVQRVQQRVAGAVRRRAGARRLATLAVVLGLAAKGTLVDTALLGARERQAHMLQLEHGLGTHAAHVFDRVLVADVVGALDGVVHVPAPVVVRDRRWRSRR